MSVRLPGAVVGAVALTLTGLVGGLAFVTACSDEGPAGNGARCVLHVDCESGICGDGACLAPGHDDDGDEISNRDEQRAGSDPLNADSDGDGRPDGAEIGPDPDNPADTDGDGRPDYRESSTADRDLDGEPDETDPIDEVPDLDVGLPCIGSHECGDGICAGGQCYGADEDLDEDGLDNGTERRLGTNPLNSDTDADGKRDGEEVGADPAAAPDQDGDGRIDALESDRVDSDLDGTFDENDPA
ncbi:hypothetical protein L6V77_31175 [Myxococcota bacterium]|nr:hypothetical protein [Myxococcota bacterium]